MYAFRIEKHVFSGKPIGRIPDWVWQTDTYGSGTMPEKNKTKIGVQKPHRNRAYQHLIYSKLVVCLC
jgi:hypothetical protein